jgi:2-hydroxy-6-oxonona-2,4-dienedioate hydrolase
VIAEKKLRDKIEGLRSHTGRVGKFNIHHVEAGTGKPIILIHGANIGWGQWYKNIASLARHFKVYAIDLPGSGRSSRLNFTEMDMDRDLVETVSEFIRDRGLSKAHIVGHSVGGWIAMKLALQKPEQVDKLILVNSLGFSNHVPWGYRPVSFYLGAHLLSKTVMSPTRDNMRNFLAGVLYNKEGVSEDFISYYHEAVITDPYGKGMISHPFMIINRLFKPLRIRDEFVMRQHLPKIFANTLIVAGDKDPLLPIEKQRRDMGLISGAKLEILSDTGHVVPMERPEEFNSMLIGFLK